MGKNTKIICTIVPNGRNNTEYFFSVFLTPRLPDSGILKDYFEIQHWTDFLDFFRSNNSLKVRVNSLIGSGGSYTIDPNSSQSLKPLPVFDKTQIERIKSEANFKIVWNKLFQPNTPVKGWITDEGEAKAKISALYNIEELKKHLDDQTQKDALDKFLNGTISLDALFSTIKTSQASSESIIKHLKQLQFQDLGKVRMSEDEIKLRNKENQEFHKKISILADYPHLLRLTGWIHDFSITLENGIDEKYNIIKLDGLNDFKGKTDDYSKWANFINEIDFKTPWTYFNPDDFNIQYADLPNLNYFKIKNGFIKKKVDTIYDIRAKQFDIKLLTEKLKHTLTEKKHFAWEKDANLTEQEIEKKYDAETVNLIRNYRKEKDSEKTDIISNGIGIQIETKVLQSVVDNDPDTVNKSLLLKIQTGTDQSGNPTYEEKRNEELNIDDYILFGHNLDTGYWIDVRKEGLKEFSSLCLRTADYAIDKSPYSDKKNLETFISNFEDEPWVAESAQAGKSGVLYADEELCRWNNWSLTCPHIGNYPQDETTVENYEFNDVELQNIRPFWKGNDKKLKALPTLRFGEQYSFRIKVVDICGNSPSKKNNSWEDKDYIINSELYKRLEQVNPPNIHFGYPIYEIRKDRKTGVVNERNIHEGHEGEDLLTLVIKTKIVNGIPKFIKDCERVVSAPKSSLHFVEVHGVLDSIFQSHSLEIYNKASYISQEASLEHFKGRSETPYLTDPAAIGFKLKLIENPIEESITNWKTKGDDYLKRIFNSILLTSSDNEDKKINLEGIPSNYQIRVLLKPGTISKGTVESIIDEKPNGSAESIFNIAYAFKEGGGYSKPIDITFIHAVQKPIVRNPDNTQIYTGEKYGLSAILRDRTPSSDKEIEFGELYFLKLEDKLNKVIAPDKFPVSTSSEFKLVATVREVLLDETMDSGFKIIQKQFTKIFSNLDEGHKLKCEDDNDSSEFLNKCNSFSHSFGNTKHYKATYQIEAVSRFKEYFPKEKEFSIYGELLNKEKATEHIINNSAKPDALIIDAINLVFTWNKKEDEESRTQNKCKVYFKGQPFLTGEGEKVAVLFIDRKKELDNNGNIVAVKQEDFGTIPDDCEGLVSEYGSDPTVYQDKRTSGITDDFFKTDYPIVGMSDNNIIDSRLLVRGEQRFSTPFTSITKQYFIKAAIFDILWDKDSKRFYCELEINPNEISDSYTPFIKFALCRYQEHSITDIQTKSVNGNMVIAKSSYDFRFSNVIMSPQVQVMPTRTVKKTDHEYILNTGKIIKKDYSQKPNEFWLILEPDNDNDFASLVENNSSEKLHFRTKKIDMDKDGLITIAKSEIKKFDSAYIEEFEFYDVDDKFKMNDTTNDKGLPVDEKGNETAYNPRNDIRKRLVFTYKLNKL